MATVFDFYAASDLQVFTIRQQFFFHEKNSEICERPGHMMVMFYTVFSSPELSCANCVATYRPSICTFERPHFHLSFQQTFKVAITLFI